MLQQGSGFRPAGALTRASARPVPDRWVPVGPGGSLIVGPLAALRSKMGHYPLPGTAEHGTTVIRHTVAFRLKHRHGSIEEHEFFRAAGGLAAIPGVEKFTCLRQINSGSPYDYGLSMEFAGREHYQQYNVHPVHVQFVKERWKLEVAAYMELDFEVMD